MRTMAFLGLVVLCGAASSSPASAANDPVAPTGTRGPDIEVTTKAEKKICRREQSVGTRLARPVCLTRSEWKARDRMNEDEKGRILDRLNSTPGEKILPGEPTGG